MFLRSTNRKKDGKDHRYFSIVENRRLLGGKTTQRTVLYLGEINDQQQRAWRKTLEVFDENEQRYATVSLFPDDQPIPADAVDSVQVKLSGLELRRPRVFGNRTGLNHIEAVSGIDGRTHMGGKRTKAGQHVRLYNPDRRGRKPVRTACTG